MDESVSGIEALVCADIARRQKMGTQKYGQTVADNPLPLVDWLRRAYEECLDQAIYLRRAMSEITDKELGKHRFSDFEAWTGGPPPYPPDSEALVEYIDDTRSGAETTKIRVARDVPWNRVQWWMPAR